MRLTFALLTLLAAALARADEPCKPVKPCEVPQGTAAVPEAPAELTAEVKQLFALVACEGAPPEGLDARAVKAYCARKAKREEQARAERIAVAAAVPSPRPEGLPGVVVAPLSSDLLAARAAFPDARNYTLAARAPAGDPRPASLRDPKRLAAFLDEAARAAEPGAAPQAALPALLAALALDGAEPVGLRYFRVEPGGALRFHGAAALASLGDAAWQSCELLFVKRGEPGRQLVARYVSADLGDAGVEAAPGPLAYLAAKGSFAALLPSEGAAAGPGYGRLRALLAQRAALVVAPRRAQ